ncbi:hypothetical protein CC80DRAFT_554097 [Byssothecium circinans]|uniref:Uncharacterized protein n=1 Tax=Byssothecium circinans TaxID=147558 RepID=A0A6A5TGH6_9PLEO|nr:hypothetical protein CC80DRAFT_554097 [Byssothecium circinans]
MEYDPAVFRRLDEVQRANQAVINAFAAHPAFEAQRSKGKGRIFTLWEYSTETDGILDNLLKNYPLTDTPAPRHSRMQTTWTDELSESEQHEMRDDAVGRCIIVHQMIHVPADRVANMFHEEVTPDMGDDVRKAAKLVHYVIFEIDSEKAREEEQRQRAQEQLLEI